MFCCQSWSYEGLFRVRSSIPVLEVGSLDEDGLLAAAPHDHAAELFMLLLLLLLLPVVLVLLLLLLLLLVR